MRKKPILVSALITFIVLIGSQVSGNQPKRDAVTAAEKQLDIDLESRMIVVGDISLHVVFAGPEEGEPVILLHGYPEFWYAWRGPMAVLANSGYRVIVPDQRGYNKSDKPTDVDSYRLDKLAGDVVGLADALGYRKFNLAGHDFGGQVSWWTALLYPERINGLAVINKPHPYAEANYVAVEEEIDWYNAFLQIPMLPGYVARLANWEILVANLKATALPNTFPEADVDQFRSAWDNNGAIHSMGAWYRANANFKMDVGDGRVKIPTLIVLAPNDAFTAKDLASRSAMFLDQGKEIKLQEGTHWVIQEKPELIGDTLAGFYRSYGAFTKP